MGSRQMLIGGVILPVEPWETTARRTGTRDVYPDGCMDIVWTAGRLVAAGPSTRRMDVALRPGARSAGLRFPGGALPALLGVPAAVVRDQVVPLDEFWPDAEERWTRRIASAADPTRVLASLVREQARVPAPHGALLRDIERRARIGMGVAAMAADLGYSERHLRRLSLDAFGYGPRTLGRIHRFLEASRSLRRGSRPADAAASAGYADQPHMVREFQALAGRTPMWFTPRR